MHNLAAHMLPVVFRPAAGQAFAKHYNPLLSQETSQESVDSSNQHQAVLARRLDEHAQTNQADTQDLSTAATRHVRQLADTAATTHVRQDTDTAAKAQEEPFAQLSAGQALDGVSQDAPGQQQESPATVDTSQKPLSASKDGKTGTQKKLGNQIALALQRHGRGVQSSQQATPVVATPVTTGQRNSASVVDGSDSVEASNACKPTASGQQASPAPATPSSVPAAMPLSDYTLPGSLPPSQPTLTTADDVQCSGPSAAAMLQSMTARATSYRTGIRPAETPASPVPSIDRFSSTSSWGASTVPSSAHHSRAIDSVLTVASTGLGDTDVPSDQPSVAIKVVKASISRQQAQSRGFTDMQKSKLAMIERKASTGTMRAMHDSSSSWSTQSSLQQAKGSHGPAFIPRTAALSKKQIGPETTAKQSLVRAAQDKGVEAVLADMQKNTAPSIDSSVGAPSVKAFYKQVASSSQTARCCPAASRFGHFVLTCTFMANETCSSQQVSQREGLIML